MVLVTALAACGQADDRTFTLTPRGGQLNAGAVTLTVPPGAVASAVEITITIYETTDPQVIRGTAHALKPLEQTFRRPVELTLWLDPGALPHGTAPNDLWLGRQSGATWTRAGSNADVDPARWVSASVTGLGTYAVIGELAPADGGTDRGAGDLPPQEMGQSADMGPPDQTGDLPEAMDAGLLDLPPLDSTLDTSSPADAANQTDTANAPDASGNDA